MIGVDNDMRQTFFGSQGSTARAIEAMCQALPRYEHHFPAGRLKHDVTRILTDLARTQYGAV